MNLRVSRLELRAALDRVLSVVPTRPLVPAHGQVHIYEDRARYRAYDRAPTIIEGTDGSMYAHSILPAEPDPGFDELVPAFKLNEMLKQISDPRILLDVGRSSHALLTGDGSAPGQISHRFVFPLLANPDQFPAWQADADATPVARGIPAGPLAAALLRVAHALGGPETGNPAWRLVQLRLGVATAYSGRRLQEARFPAGGWNQQGRGDPLAVLLPDVAIPGLVKFLKSVTPTTEVAIHLVPQARAGGEVRYVTVDCGFGGFYWPHPRVAFTDLEVTRANAERHRQASARLDVSRTTLLRAVRAARIQADPDAPALVIDVTQPQGAPIRVVAGPDSANLFEMTLPGARLVERGARIDTVSYLLDDLQAILDACPDETVHLYVAPPIVTAASGHRQKPLTTLVDSQGALSVVPQLG